MSRDMLQTPILLAVSFLTQLTANHKLICMKINKNVSRYPKIPLNKNWTGITCGTTLYRSLRCLFTSFVIFHDALKCSSDKRATGGNKIRETPIFVVSPRQSSFSHRIRFWGAPTFYFIRSRSCPHVCFYWTSKRKRCSPDSALLFLFPVGYSGLHLLVYFRDSFDAEYA